MAVLLPNRGATLLWIGVAILAAVLIGGWVFIDMVSRAGSDFQQQDLEVVASIAATSFEPDAVRSLMGGEDKASSPVLAAIRGKLSRIKQRIPEARFVYLAAQWGRVLSCRRGRPNFAGLLAARPGLSGSIPDIATCL